MCTRTCGVFAAHGRTDFLNESLSFGSYGQMLLRKLLEYFY